MNTYPIIFNINIFSFIKTIDDYRNNNILKLKNFRNEIRYIKSKEITLADQTRIKELYQEKMDTMNEIKILNSTSNLIDMMFQQEIKNSVLFKKYFYMFYIQKIINVICSNNSNYFLPNEYKNPYDCGYYDKVLKRSLLRKILNQ
jgi:oligoribonuclease NrnB/cAMP/cGMP phosphodiesterase (DHH superfamily)